METSQTTDLIKVEEITSIMQGAPNVITENETSVTKCKAAGQTFIDTIESIGEINSDELDAQIAAFLDKAKKTVKKINDKRTPITQLLTRVSKVFTTLENDIDVTKSNTVPYQLQQYRNKYATRKLVEKQKKEEEAKKQLAIENEKVYFKTEYKKELHTFFNSFLADKIEAIQAIFTAMTLDNFETNKSIIVNYPETFDPNTLITNYIEKVKTSYLPPVDKISIRQRVIQEVSQEFTTEYTSKIRERKTGFRDLFNSKYIELKELAEAAKKDQETFARLQAEKKERERLEQARIQQEADDRQRKLSEDTEREKQAAQMSNLFNTAAIVSADTQQKVKVTKKVEITSAAGFMQVYQLWMEREGMFLPNEELAKLHKKMIAYVEKLANGKEEEMIKSEYIKYVDDVKAK